MRTREQIEKSIAKQPFVGCVEGTQIELLLDIRELLASLLQRLDTGVVVRKY